jgi:hypothetical protein
LPQLPLYYYCGYLILFSFLIARIVLERLLVIVVVIMTGQSSHGVTEDGIAKVQ